MSFDPDAFLAETEKAPKGGFDPDAFLASNEETPKPKALPEPNLDALKTLKPAKDGEAPKEAKTLLEALESGYDLSVAGLVSHGAKPDMVLPQNAPMFHRIAHSVGQLIPDIPVMMAGAAAGAVAGTAAAGPVGGVLGGGFGADALPTAIRETLMKSYEEGSVHSFGEFWEKAAPVMLETVKRGGISALTMGVGSKVAKVVGPLAESGIAGLVASKTAVAASEIGTMTTVGAGLEGRVPEPHEFLDAAVLVGGIHGVTHVAGKLMKTFGKTGVSPDQAMKEAETSPSINEDLNSSNIDVPRAFDETPKNQVEVGGELGAKSNVLQDDGVPVKVTKPEVPEAKPKGEEGTSSVILDHIGEKPEKAGLTMKEVVRVTLDDLDPLKHLDEEAYIQARNSRGVQGLVNHFVEHGAVDFNTGETVGKSLQKILEPVNTDQAGFKEFAIAKRAQELHGRGIETGIDAGAVDAAVKNGSKYEKAFKELGDYQTSTLKYLMDSGIINEKMFTKIQEANKSYVPFYRIFDETPGSAGKGLKVRNPVKKIKGSEAKISDPIESIVKNTQLFVQLAERQRVLQKLTDDANLESGLIQKVPAKQKPVEVTAKEVNKFLKEYGIDDSVDEGFNIFRPIRKQTLAADEIAVFKEGKREIYKVPEGVAKAVNALDRESANFLVKILSYPAKALRVGATLTPDFMARNFVRDQNSAFVFSKNGYIPVIDFMKGFTSTWKQDSHFWEWAKSGGMNAHMTAIDDTYINQNVWGLDKSTEFMSKVRNPVKSVYQLLSVTSELVENATRLGEFKRAKANGKTNKQAAFESREVTLDFARRGANTQSVNLITAFWNAQVQGVDRIRTAFTDDPVGTTAKIGASITLPSLALWWANHDDPRWKEIPRWQKDLFWIVMTDDHVYRIPKPFELGLVFGSLPERAMDSFFNENPNAMKDFGDSLLQAFTPSLVPTFATPIISQYANKNTFTGFPIVPRAKENLLPELQYSDYTSETSKKIGQLVGYLPGANDSSLRSPAVIENYISAWSGNLGRYALSIGDEILEKAGMTKAKEKPSLPLAQKPVIKAFMIRYPGANAQSIQDFYSNQKEVETVYASFKNIEKVEGAVEAKSFAQRYDYDFRRLNSYLKQSKKAMTNMHKMIDKIELMNIKPDEKRQQIDAVYYKMINAAKYSNDTYRDFKAKKIKVNDSTLDAGDE